MVENIINDITEKYYNEEDEYYGEYREDENGKDINMKDELDEALTEKGIEHVIGYEDGFSSCGYDNNFLAIAYIDENGSLGLSTILLELM